LPIILIGSQLSHDSLEDVHFIDSTFCRMKENKGSKNWLTQRFVRIGDFRCLIITAAKKMEKSKGRITNQDNSGTVGAGVEDELGFEDCVRLVDGDSVGKAVGAGAVEVAAFDVLITETELPSGFVT